uniref:Cryptochrome/DNA photolyase FAD-binding domain-containing protein n=1 Tax=Paramoeba aestuarina TaxID=180227 RepID=A0A7S4JGI0_9EUKA|mmetsp:Transcript_10165/g.15340  ORF Transcript_10165/g.15340 Transcript_10165/m.15340 type:complete len:222 (+) Transcript_10165:3-668(+)
MRELDGPTPENCAIDPPKSGWRFDPLLISRFCSGVTGFPFVDAAMRELTMTGFTSAQCRRALLSFLVRGLQQDWRVAAEWFQRCLIDYDPHICWGNSLYYSGLIFDISSRIPTHTAEHHHLQFDGSGVFTRLWVPELHRVPSYCLFKPQSMTRHMQEMHGARIGIDYPVPMKLWHNAEKDLGFVSQLPNYINKQNANLIGEGTQFGLGVISDSGMRLKLTA